MEDELFVTTEFFDPNDLLQVKYEMVRRVRDEGQPISHAARVFGFSRPTVYQALSAFEQGGLAALLPQRPGPRRAHKLSEEVVDFLDVHWYQYHWPAFNVADSSITIGVIIYILSLIYSR